MRDNPAAIGALALIVSMSALVAAAQEPGPMERAPKGGASPNGSLIREAYGSPPRPQTALAAVGTGSDIVSANDVLTTLYADPEIQKRVERGLGLLPKAVTKIPIGLAPGPGQPPELSLYKFDYELLYKGVRFSRFSGESIVIRVAGKERTPLYTRERNIPDLDTLGDTTPTVSKQAAVDAAKRDLARERDDLTVVVDIEREPVRREIFVQVDQRNRATLSWMVVLKSNTPARPFARRYWVSATGVAAVLHKEDLVSRAAPPGTVAGMAGRVTGDYWGIKSSSYDPKVCDGPLADYFAVGESVVTDQDGRFPIAPASDRPSVGTKLAGPFCLIVDENHDPNKKIWNPAPNGGVNYAFKTDDPFQLAQVSAFHWVNFAHEFVRDRLSARPDKLMKLKVQVNVDAPGFAEWDSLDGTLNFGRAGGSFPNLAYASVVFHEYGHAFDNQFEGSSIDGAYIEGFADAFSILITKQSLIAKDYYGVGTPLRNAAEVVTWPPQPGMNDYQVGKIYAGFTWQLTRELLRRPDLKGDENKVFAIAKELVLGAAAQSPKDIPRAVQLCFYSDYQGGSHYFDELARAADSRKIPRPKDRNAQAQPKNIGVAAVAEPEAEDVTAYYKNLKPPVFQDETLDANRSNQLGSFNPLSQSRSLGLLFIADYTSSFRANNDVFKDLAPRPRSNAEVLRLCASKVQDLLAKRNESLQLAEGVPVLTPPSTNADVAEGDHTITIRGEFQEHGKRQLDRWTFNFGLTYKNIPLDPSSSVSVLVWGDDTMRINWRNVPDRIPDDLGVDANVGENHAQNVAKADFLNLITNRLRERNANHEPVLAGDLSVTAPSKQLWFGPDGVGRLIWNLAVTAKPRKDIAVTGAQYWIEARTDEKEPKILARSQSVLHADTGRVTGTVWLTNSDSIDHPKWQTAPLSNFLVAPAPPVHLQPRETDNRGIFAADGFGNLPAAVSALEGTICAVYDMSRAGNASFVPNQNDGTQPYVIQFDATDINDAAQVNAFYWVNRGFDYYKDQYPLGAANLKRLLNVNGRKIQVLANFDPQIQTTCYQAEGRQLYLTVNLGGNPKRLGFNEKLNGSCRDYVLHEFAHAIDRTGTPPKVGIKEAPDPESPDGKKLKEDEHLANSYSEGFADAFVIFATKELAFGKGIRANGVPVRDYGVHDELKFGDFDCYDCYNTLFGDDKIHFAGRVYAHFVCDLIAKFSERNDRRDAYDAEAFDKVARLVLAADAQNPVSIPDAVRWMYELSKTDIAVRAAIQAAADYRKIPFR